MGDACQRVVKTHSIQMRLGVLGDGSRMILHHDLPRS